METQEEKIPSWLFFALWDGKKLTPENEKLAQKIIKSLKEKAKNAYWHPRVLEQVLYVNPHDNARGYYPEIQSNKK